MNMNTMAIYTNNSNEFNKRLNGNGNEYMSVNSSRKKNIEATARTPKQTIFVV